MPIRKQKPPKGIPPSVIHIWKRGERVRFNGGWLGDSEQDRAIAEWVDTNSRSAWTQVKVLIYLYITGRIGVSNGTGANGEPQFQKADDVVIGDAAKALGDFDF